MTPVMTSCPDLRPAHHVLVVDDDRQLREHVAAYLSDHGYSVRAASDAVSMDRALAEVLPDLVILDVMMPGEDGLSVCRRLSDEASRPAIIIVSALGEEVDRVLGLELGADDYLAKPCSPRELLARVRAILRRLDEAPGETFEARTSYRFSGFVLDAQRRQLRAPTGTTILLTSGEYSLLRAFLDNPQRILVREQLVELARGDQVQIFSRAIDVQISRLRRKLHACLDGEVIKTVRGVGYILDAEVSRL